MLSFNSGVSALAEFQKQIDVIGNNIANVNTTGYRSSRVNFADAFSNTLRGSSSSADGTSVSAMQVGTGVNSSAISSNFTLKGTIEDTGDAEDLAISGEGYFLVRDTASNEVYATRDGNFHLDSNGYLVNANGLRVQGYTDTSLTARGDIKIDNTRDGTTPLAFTDDQNTIAADYAGYSIGSDGSIKVVLDGVSGSYTRGQILLQRFTNPQALVKEGGNLYSGINSAGALGGGSPQSEAPNTNGLGGIQNGCLESSNVDLTQEMTGLITAQRAFQASSKIITTSDEVLQEVVNLKR